MPKPATSAMVLAAAVGVPYAVDQSGVQLSQIWPSSSATTAADPPVAAPPAAKLGLPVAPPIEIPAPPSPTAIIYQSPAPLEGIPTYALIDVLRMDVTREWVYERWARKSTGLTDLELFGIRVPLVTGTRMSDLAGSLTYYFNRAGQVDRLSFRGSTGDTRELVQLLMQHYGLKPAQSVAAGEYLYQLKEDDRLVSELRIRPAPILWTTAPHENFLLEMELNRPGSNRYVTRPPVQIDLPEPIAVPTPGRVPVDPNSPLGQVQTNVEQAAAAEAEAKQVEVAAKAQADAAAAQKAAAEAEAAAPPKSTSPPRVRWPG